MSSPARPVTFAAVALLCAVLGWLLQFAIVNFRYGGNWTGLFCTGSHHARPAELAHENIVVLHDSRGYDGQMYHYVAHDPLVRTGIQRAIDDAQLRYKRILLPALAYLLALGQQSWIDAAYVAANLAFLFVGAWWLSRYLSACRADPRWAVLFVLAPASLVALDRLVVDLAFTSLCIGAAYYARAERFWKSYFVLVLACLTRDTGFLLAAAFVIAKVLERQAAKGVALATTVLPAVAWYVYVNSRTPPRSLELASFIPFEGLAAALLHPAAYRSGAIGMALASLDRLALVGILLAAVLALMLMVRNGFGAIELAAVAWGLLALCMPRDALAESNSAGRVFTPLLMYVAMAGLPAFGWRTAIPFAAAVPRTAAEVGVPLLAAMLNN